MSDMDHVNTVGRRLMHEALTSPQGASGDVVNDLLSLFWRGLQVELITELLHSPHKQTILGGFFIVEELGQKAAPVLDAVVECLNSEDPDIREGAYIAVGDCALDGLGRAWPYVICGVTDPAPGCRKAAMLMIMRATQDDLANALETMRRSGSDERIVDALGLLLASKGNTSLYSAWLEGDNELLRRFGVIAAGRIQDTDLLAQAAKSRAVDISAAADGYMRLLAIRRKRTQNGEKPRVT